MAAVQGSRRGRRKSRLVNEINVVPYIDVMLVLLVIFMVTAPFVPTATIELPTVGAAKSRPEAFVEVVVEQNGAMTVRTHNLPQRMERRATSEQLLDTINEMVGGNAALPVVISGDREVRYDAILRSWTSCSSKGVQARRPDGQAPPELITPCARGPARRRARRTTIPDATAHLNGDAKQRQDQAESETARPRAGAVPAARWSCTSGLFAFLFVGIRWQKTTPIAQAELWLPSMIAENAPEPTPPQPTPPEPPAPAEPVPPPAPARHRLRHRRRHRRPRPRRRRPLRRPRRPRRRSTRHPRSRSSASRRKSASARRKNSAAPSRSANSPRRRSSRRSASASSRSKRQEEERKRRGGPQARGGAQGRGAHARPKRTSAKRNASARRSASWPRRRSARQERQKEEERKLAEARKAAEEEKRKAEEERRRKEEERKLAAEKAAAEKLAAAEKARGRRRPPPPRKKPRSGCRGEGRCPAAGCARRCDQRAAQPGRPGRRHRAARRDRRARSTAATTRGSARRCAPTPSSPRRSRAIPRADVRGPAAAQRQDRRASRLTKSSGAPAWDLAAERRDPPHRPVPLPEQRRLRVGADRDPRAEGLTRNKRCPRRWPRPQLT